MTIYFWPKSVNIKRAKIERMILGSKSANFKILALKVHNTFKVAQDGRGRDILGRPTEACTETLSPKLKRLIL